MRIAGALCAVLAVSGRAMIAQQAGEGPPRPWTDLPVLDDPQRFHVAILGDRTGGHRPGVWMRAMRAVNLLRPEFVVSVGDLIEGYSTDRAELERQWREFTGFLDRLDMRFYFVAGNHDVSNPLMHDLWRERFGREWYSFDHRGVHFLCLSSEDPETRIGEEQLDWIERDLRRHRDARWTLVFLHKPLWTWAERALAAGDPDPTNWTRVEKMLRDRPHTVFAGHVHHYVRYERGGRRYYSLGTAGGASRLRGRPYGEFDHVVWLTMERDGPRVANVFLDGVAAADVVTEASIRRFRRFLAEVIVTAAPILVAGERLEEGTIRLRLANRFDRTVAASGMLVGLPLRGLTLEPERFVLRARPGAAESVDVRFRLGEPLESTRFARTALRLRIASEEKPPLVAEVTTPVVIDRLRRMARVAVRADGDLSEWPPEGFVSTLSAEPLVRGDRGGWQGPGDAGLSFQVAHHEQRVWVGIRVRDDTVLAGDGVEIAWGPLRGRLRRLIVEPGPPGKPHVRAVGRGDAAGCVAAWQRRKDGYDLEIGLPPPDGRVLRLGLGLRDRDEPRGRVTVLSRRGGRTFHFTR